MTDADPALVARAVDCAAWPAWLHAIVDRVNASVDAGTDLSTEQAIALGILEAQAMRITEPDAGPAEPTRLELAVWCHDDAVEFAAKDPWEYGDRLRIRGMLASMQGLLAAVLDPDRMTEAEAELEKLVRYFRTEGFLAFGNEGDIAGHTPSDTAIEAMRLLAQRLSADRAPVTDDEVEIGMKAFAMVAHDLTAEAYDVQRAAAVTPKGKAAMDKSLAATRATLQTLKRLDRK